MFRSRRAVALLAVAAALLPAAVSASMPWPSAPAGQDPYAYQDYLRSSTPPSEFSPSDWKLTSAVDPAVPPTAQELGGVMGPSVDRAWQVTTGRPDVRIAVLDSGIMWNDSAMSDLRDKVYINWAELPPPQYRDSAGVTVTACAGTTLPPRRAATPFPHCYDVNHDGVLNIQDYAQDPRVTAPAHALFMPGELTPEDLIEVFSCYDAATGVVGQVVGVTPDGTRHCDNGAENVDNDRSGFAHDIAGWNFMERTNDPYDEPHYGHGTGEARDSNAEADNGGDVGTCPSCMVMPLKVGDSFVADVNDFAQAVLFAVDQGAAVVQEALGTLNHSQLGQAAVDYAWRHGVVVVASAADEEAGHHNWPSSYNHTIVVNSLRSAEVANSAPAPPGGLPQPGRSYLVLNGCTNYGGHTTVSVPSGACSSEATGKSAGMVGLVVSTALNQVALGRLRPYAPGMPLSADEVKQIVAGTADDVDFEDPASPYPPDGCEPHAAYPPGPPANYASLEGGERFHSIAGWDQYFGYGRINADCMVRAVLAGRIPPEAEIDSPSWFANLDTATTGSFTVTGRVAAVRAASYRYSVQLAYGVQPHESDWRTVYSSGTLSRPVTGTLATLSAAEVRAAMAAYVPGAYPHAVDPNGDQTDWLVPPASKQPGTDEWDQDTLTLRVVVLASDGLRGEDRHTLQSHHDDSVAGVGASLTGFPVEMGTDGASSPVAADLTGDGHGNQVVLGTSDGQVHVLDQHGRELQGWPQPSSPIPFHIGEPAFADREVAAAAAVTHAAILGSAAVGDLDRTGHLEVAVTDMQGYLSVYEADGRMRPGFPVRINPAYSAPGVPPFFNRDPDNRVQTGIVAPPVLADLDNDGRLWLVVAALDRHVYAWSPQGVLRPGFPVLLASPEKVTSVDAVTHRVHLKPNSGADTGSKIVSAPAVGDLLGDGHQEIVVGRNEEYAAAQDGGFNASTDSYPADPVISRVEADGNGRVYAVFSDGYCHGVPVCPSTPPDAVPVNAYVPHWPVKVGISALSLLPYVGSGIDTGPALASFPCPLGTGGDRPGLKVGVFSADGPVYVFQSDGSSCYGQGPGVDGLMHDRAADSMTLLGDSSDSPYLAAFGQAAFGDLGHGQVALLTATAGARKLLDAAVDDHQLGAQNQVTAWNASTGRAMPGFPHHMNDLQFLTGPAVADLTGTGVQDVVVASATSDLRVLGPGGAELPGMVKNTGGWTIAVPLVASLGDDPHLAVTSITREGTLSAFDTPAGACAPASWPRFRHDTWNTGRLGAVTDRPEPVGAVTASLGAGGLTLAFTAPHGDGRCGDAVSYEVRVAACGTDPVTLQASAPVATPAARPAGSAETLSVATPSGGSGVVEVQAVNAASRRGGDLGAPAYATVGTCPHAAGYAAATTAGDHAVPVAAPASLSPASSGMLGTAAPGGDGPARAAALVMLLATVVAAPAAWWRTVRRRGRART